MERGNESIVADASSGTLKPPLGHHVSICLHKNQSRVKSG